MVDDDVLFRFRLRLFSLAAELGNVREACRVFGIHHSTYYRWRGPVLRSGLEMLRPRERRPPRMPDQTSQLVEQRIVAFSLGHPGLGPRRISATLAQERWGGISVSPNGVWRVLRRHGLSRRISRLSLVAGYASPPGPEPAEPPVERHVEVDHPGELVGFDRHDLRRALSVSGGTPPSTSRARSSGRSWPRRRSTHRLRGRASSRSGSRPTSVRTAGDSSGCSPTTGASSARPPSARPSGTWEPSRRSSAQGDPPPTVPSSGSSGPSSRNAGGRPSPGASCPSSVVSCVTSRGTSTSTTSSAPTPDG